MAKSSPRPEYGVPPVIEVVLSVQFEPIEGLKSPQLGVLWQRFKQDFPHVEEHPPLPSVTEDFGLRAARAMGLQIETVDLPFTPRVWFLSESKTELIQVQQDRFIHNWRKTDSGQIYPRYEHISPRFKKELEAFIVFVGEQGLPSLKINQCEITYINHIVAGEGWESHSDVKAVIAPWSGTFSDDFLTNSEDLNLNTRFVIPSAEGSRPLGRLHMNLQSAYRSMDQKQIFVFTLTSRGRPLNDQIDGAFQFLDIGREWIVRGFTSFTTPEMHKVWRRTQ